MGCTKTGKYEQREKKEGKYGFGVAVGYARKPTWGGYGEPPERENGRNIGHRNYVCTVHCIWEREQYRVFAGGRKRDRHSENLRSYHKRKQSRKGKKWQPLKQTLPRKSLVGGGGEVLGEAMRSGVLNAIDRGLEGRLLK